LAFIIIVEANNKAIENETIVQIKAIDDVIK
jgi:hypothetical protein